MDKPFLARIYRYRVYWGNGSWQFTDYDAMTAQDALVIATLNLKQNDLQPLRIEFLKIIEKE